MHMIKPGAKALHSQIFYSLKLRENGSKKKQASHTKRMPKLNCYIWATCNQLMQRLSINATTKCLLDKGNEILRTRLIRTCRP